MIKFRAWEKNLEEIIPVHEIDFDNKMINTNSAWRMFDEIELMQWTGMKDTNGKEIFEGDIVKGHWWDKGKSHRHIGIVNFGMASFSVVGIKQYLGMSDLLNPTYEIIGNIYENLDLI
jgi:uncharacterized phage protein (TIGR01671 family)